MKEPHSIGYYLGRVFRRLPDNEAKELAIAGITQLEQEGYKGIGYQSLFDAIKTAHAHPDSKRMQTEIWKTPHIDPDRFPWSYRPQHAQTIFGPDGEEVLMFPRRLVTTYETKYKPSNFTLGIQEWERLSYLDKMRGMDTRLVARLARQNPKVKKEVYATVLEQGVKYGLLLTLTTDSSTLTQDRGPLTDAEGNEIPHIRKLKLIFPKTNQEQREIMNAFLEQYQIPNSKLVDKLLGIID